MVSFSRLFHIGDSLLLTAGVARAISAVTDWNLLYIFYQVTRVTVGDRGRGRGTGRGRGRVGVGSG